MVQFNALRPSCQWLYLCYYELCCNESQEMDIQHGFKNQLVQKTEKGLDSWFIRVEPPVLRFLLDRLRVKFPIELASSF